MTVKLLTEHHLEFLSLKGGCKGSYESTLVKIPHCWKSHVTAHMFLPEPSSRYYIVLAGSKDSGDTVHMCQSLPAQIWISTVKPV